MWLVEEPSLLWRLYGVVTFVVVVLLVIANGVVQLPWPWWSDIGRRRYCPEPIDVLYPGEQATPERFHSVRAGDRIGVIVTVWRIEPMPGLRGWWLRWRYRLLVRPVAPHEPASRCPSAAPGVPA